MQAATVKRYQYQERESPKEMACRKSALPASQRYQHSTPGFYTIAVHPSGFLRSSRSTLAFLRLPSYSRDYANDGLYGGRGYAKMHSLDELKHDQVNGTIPIVFLIAYM